MSEDLQTKLDKLIKENEKLKKDIERLRVIAYNGIVIAQSELGLSTSEIKEEFGITKKEDKALGINAL